MPAAAKASSCSAGDSDRMMLAPIRPDQHRRDAHAGSAPGVAIEPPRNSWPMRGSARMRFARSCDARPALLQHEPIVGHRERAAGVLLDHQDGDAARRAAPSGCRTPPAPSSATARSRARRSASAWARAAGRARFRAASARRPTASRPAGVGLLAQHREALIIALHARPARSSMPGSAARRRRARGCAARTVRGRCCGPAERSRCRQSSIWRGAQLVMSAPVESNPAGAHAAAARTPP